MNPPSPPFSSPEEPDRKGEAERLPLSLWVGAPVVSPGVGYGPRDGGSQLLRGEWASEPGAIVALVGLVILYVSGLRRATAGGTRPRRPELAGFVAGWLMLFVALVSPLHTAGEQFVSAHMAQHTLLILAPLALVAGRTGTRALQALAPTWRAHLARRLKRWRPGRSAWGVTPALWLGTILVWHLPSMFELATRVSFLHSLEHMSLLAASGLYWAHILGSVRRRGERLGPALASVFVGFVSGAAAGALLVFSTVPWYPEFAARTVQQGGDWLLDQQLAGVLMSAPMGVVGMGLAAWLVWRWSGALGLESRTETARRPSSRPR